MKANPFQRTLASGLFLPLAFLTYGPMADGQTLEVLHVFEGPRETPNPWLVQGSAGNLYGNTVGGDLSQTNGQGYPYGTVYKMTPGGAFTTLVQFEGTNGDGSSQLLQASDGNFYGTTGAGGDQLLRAHDGNLYVVTDDPRTPFRGYIFQL
jgi:hypothetical protein